MKRKQTLGLPVKEFRNKIFELQIKTIFSHAWAKATHDLTYKASSISWARERVTFQIKAMLEQSEFAIANIESTDDRFFPQHEHYAHLKKLITLLSRWPKEALPKDMKRCAENISSAGKLLGMSREEITTLIQTRATSETIGKHTNLSPFHLCSLLMLAERAPETLPKQNEASFKKMLLGEEIEEHLLPNVTKTLLENNLAFKV